MKLSLLNDKDLCKALDIFSEIEKFKYDETTLKVETLKERLKVFGDAFSSWLNDLDTEIVNMRLGWGKLNLICEMSTRFKKRFA